MRFTSSRLLNLYPCGGMAYANTIFSIIFLDYPFDYPMDPI